MLDYLISQKHIILAWIIGGFLGGMLSAIVDNYYLNELEQSSNRLLLQQIIFTGIMVASIFGLLTLIFMAIDYWLYFTPLPTYIRFTGYDNFWSGLIWSFILGMSSTIIRICERAMSSSKSD